MIWKAICKVTEWAIVLTCWPLKFRPFITWIDWFWLKQNPTCDPKWIERYKGMNK